MKYNQSPYNARKRCVRITENDLRNIVKQVIREAAENGKKQYEWHRTVNRKGDGDILYKVGIWPGIGYQSVTFDVYADSDEGALDTVVAYLDKKHDLSLLIQPEEVERIKDELIQDGESEEMADRLTDEQYLYIDATKVGASQPWYILSDHLMIEPQNNLNESIRRVIRRYLR